jgi:16S rRNA processing protein RimM
LTLVSVGRVGRAHGRDGSFYVEGPDRVLEIGAEVTVAGRRRRIERCGGTDQRPLLRLDGLEDRDAVAELRGQTLLVETELEGDEWLSGQLVGCRVGALGRVTRVLEGPSCDVLELDDGTLVPFISDAVRAVDAEAGVIEVDLEFLGRP